MSEINVFDRIRNRIKPETTLYVHKNLKIIAEVSRIMLEKKWTQKDFAKKLGKSESEISKWLSGSHNLTLKSIAKMEAVLGATLLEVPAPKDSQPEIKYVVLTIERSFPNYPAEDTQNCNDISFDELETENLLVA